MGVYQFWLTFLLFSMMAVFVGQGSLLPRIVIASDVMQWTNLSNAKILEGARSQYTSNKQTALPHRNTPWVNPPRSGFVSSERASMGVETSRGSLWLTLGYAVALVISAALIPILLRCYRRTLYPRGGGRQESNLLYRFIHTR